MKKTTTSNTLQEDCPSELRWARFVTHRLPPHEIQELQQHIEVCETCRQRNQERVESNTFLHQQPNWQALLEKGEKRLAKIGKQALFQTNKGDPQHPISQQKEWLQKIQHFWKGTIRWNPIFWGEGFASVVVVMLIFWGLSGSIQLLKTPHPNLLPKQHARKKHSSSPRLTPRKVKTKPKKQKAINKGNPKGRSLSKRTLPPKVQRNRVEMVHYRLGSKISQKTQNNEVLYPGDLIQFSYSLTKPTWVMIVSVNSKGEFSVFAPLGGKKSILVQKGAGNFPKKGSLELDDYIGYERLWILHSAQAFDLKKVQVQLRGMLKVTKVLLKQPKRLPGFEQVDTILIQKKERIVRPE